MKTFQDRIVLLAAFLFVLQALLGVQKVTAQQAILTNVPSNTANTRFYEDIFKEKIVRPALSIRGFDSSSLIGSTNYGYGLKQVLDRIYNYSDPTLVSVYDSLVSDASKDLINPAPPNKRNKIEENSRRMEARAFVALVTYILEKNGNNISTLNQLTGPDLPSHSVALADLKEGFIQSPYKDNLFVDEQDDDDLVKWVKSLANITRAIDLYLALENAYYYYGGSDRSDYNDINSTNLLSKNQKKALLFSQIDNMREINDLAHENVGDLPNWMFAVFPVLSTVVQYAIFEDVTFDELEPGNRPLKIETGLAYASLGTQDLSSDYPGYAYYFGGGLLDEGFKSVGDQDTQARKLYWSYQSDNGRRFWAEGPYYLHYALRETILFWHAIRGNDLLSFNNRNLVDPFKNSNSMLLGPLDWMADLTTSEGELPSLDDGNRIPMQMSSVMRWNSAYGDGNIGEKYAWINSRSFVNGFGSEENLRLVELAIPRLNNATGQEPLEVIGNDNASQTGEGGEQQIVIRETDGTGRDHYLLFNGESGDSIVRGEGHKQPDQLQLLYYVDDQSYLMDSGYDRGDPQVNSSWNGYMFHNTLGYMYKARNTNNGFVTYENLGGIEGPYADILKKRKVSNGSAHADVSYIYKSNFDNIVLLMGSVVIDGDDSRKTSYERRTLLIKDPDDPYVIDLNSADIVSGDISRYRMRYHFNTGLLNNFKVKKPIDDLVREVITKYEVLNAPTYLVNPNNFKSALRHRIKNLLK